MISNPMLEIVAFSPLSVGSDLPLLGISGPQYFWSTSKFSRRPEKLFPHLAMFS